MLSHPVFLSIAVVAFVSVAFSQCVTDVHFEMPGKLRSYLHLRFQHAFPSGYWPQGRLDMLLMVDAHGFTRIKISKIPPAGAVSIAPDSDKAGSEIQCVFCQCILIDKLVLLTFVDTLKIKHEEILT